MMEEALRQRLAAVEKKLREHFAHHADIEARFDLEVCRAKADRLDALRSELRGLLRALRAEAAAPTVTDPASRHVDHGRRMGLEAAADQIEAILRRDETRERYAGSSTEDTI